MSISINSTNDAVKTTMTINGKEFAAIPLELFNVNNKWQRDIASGKAKRKITTLVENWDPGQCRPVTVIYNEITKKYDVIDGGHRVEAAKLLNLGELVAEIIRPTGTQEEKDKFAAKLFAEQGDSVDRLTPAEKHKANVLIGVPANLTLELAAKEHGFTLTREYTRSHAKQKNYVYGFNEALKIAGWLPELLNRTFAVIKAIHWNEENGGLSTEGIRMIWKTFSYHMDKADEVGKAIERALVGKTPKEVFSLAMADFPGRTMTSRDLLWLEGKVCDDLKIERRFIDKKAA